MRAIKANSNVNAVFKQAVLLIATDVWIRECPAEVKREDYYCYLKFDSEDACAEAIKAKQQVPVFSVERTAEPADMFQYINDAGEPELYVRPSGSRVLGLDCSKCASGEEAFAKFTAALPDENSVMAHLCEDQDHVVINFSPSNNYEKRYSIALFRDGNAYYYENSLAGAADPERMAARAEELERLLAGMGDEELIEDMTRCANNCNLWRSLKSTKAPVDNRGQNGFFVDCAVFGRDMAAIEAFDYEPDEKQRQEFRDKGLCGYCGSAFEASLIKKCRICGRKKDY